MARFQNLGIIKNKPDYEPAKLTHFESRIKKLRAQGSWSRADPIDLFNTMIPGFNHKETGKFLDIRM